MDWTMGREGFVLLAGLQPGSRCWLQPLCSPGRGREKCLAAQFPQGMGVENTLLVHFLLCKHCLTAELCVSCQGQSPTGHQKLNNFTFPWI